MIKIHTLKSRSSLLRTPQGWPTSLRIFLILFISLADIEYFPPEKQQRRKREHYQYSFSFH
jgi:hypothetical protein